MKVYSKNENEFAESFQSVARNASRAVWFGDWAQAERLLTKLLDSVKAKQGKAA